MVQFTRVVAMFASPRCRFLASTQRVARRALALLLLALPLSGFAEPVTGASLGLPALQRGSPEQPSSPDCADLGRRLFNDRTLSADGEISCASCHSSEKAFADGQSVATGRGGRRGVRNAPSLLNVAWQNSFFWDGRAGTLETQALGPILNPIEHGVANEAELLAALRSNARNVGDFARAFPGSSPAVSLENLGKALACYERTLVAAGSPFDRYQYAGDKQALSGSAQRGLEIFRGRGGCASCHLVGPTDATFADGKYHRRGIGFLEVQRRLPEVMARVPIDAAAKDRIIISDPDVAKLGRFVITDEPRDIGSFKTPSLRNVALTPPYMHDGSVPTLERAVVLEAYYGASDGAKPVVLSARDVHDVVEFLKSLTSPWATADSAQSTVRLLGQP